ncbi:hypothetical protein HPP92_016860 [Vanilla planifolia]|uniref:Nucleotidyl transferase domain-containing protein n=1 Tax=Vanilla planifolia TaxID=51239 RepID=A0A835QGJ3_VANPL|nr:hypothetical protein HPP92_016860 [Vanilla planifolia]
MDMRTRSLPSLAARHPSTCRFLPDGGSDGAEKGPTSVFRRPRGPCSYSSSGGPPRGQLCTEVPPHHPRASQVLLPLVNAPMIEYTLAWLESVGVEEVFVFCCAHAQQVKSYLESSQWKKQSGAFCVTTIESHDAISAGDALRVIYSHGVIRGDFVLISGDTVSNMSLAKALQEHKERKKKDPLAIMTMVIKH